MAQGYYNTNPLKYVNISESTAEIVDYIDKRRKKILRSLKTKWIKINSLFAGGISPNTLITISGISGSGKSSFVNSLESDLFELNKDEDICVLSFNYEIKII